MCVDLFIWLVVHLLCHFVVFLYINQCLNITYCDALARTAICHILQRSHLQLQEGKEGRGGGGQQSSGFLPRPLSLTHLTMYPCLQQEDMCT